MISNTIIARVYPPSIKKNLTRSEYANDVFKDLHIPKIRITVVVMNVMAWKVCRGVFAVITRRILHTGAVTMICIVLDVMKYHCVRRPLTRLIIEFVFHVGSNLSNTHLINIVPIVIPSRKHKSVSDVSENIN